MRKWALSLLVLAALAVGAAPSAQQDPGSGESQPGAEDESAAVERPKRTFLRSSDPRPAVETRTEYTVDEIVLEFAEPISDATIELRDGNTEMVELGEVAFSGQTARVSTPALESGFFMVSWTATEADSGDVHLSRFTFFVSIARCAAVDSDGAWMRIPAPTFPVGPQTITSHATLAEGILAVTNGQAILQTEDGGCAWRPSYVLPASGGPTEVSRANSTITDLVAPPFFQGFAPIVLGRVVTLPIDALGVTAGASQSLLISDNFGRSFRTGGEGLPPPIGDRAGHAARCRAPAPCALDIGLGVSGFRVYLLQRLPESPTLVLFASDDLGATFAPTGAAFEDVTTEDENGYTAPLLGSGAALATTVAERDVVWATAGGYLQRSVDGGATFERVNTSTGAGFGLDYTHLASERTYDIDFSPSLDVGVRIVPPTLVAARHHDGAEGAPDAIVRQVAGGGGFEAIGVGGDLPRPIESLALGATRDTLAVALEPGDGDGLYVFEPDDRRFRPLEVPGDGPVVDVQINADVCSSVVANRGDELVRRDGALDPELDDLCSFEPPTYPELVIPALSAPEGPSGVPGLVPREITLELDVNDDTAVGYRLTKPPQGAPVDVAFLIDTSGSMSGYIDGVARGFAQLTEELVAQGIDVHFGLAEYNDYRLRYRRVVDISPPSADFVAQLRNLTTTGGSEPHYTALHQLATGAGIENPSQGYEVEPGGQMNWRDQALRIVVHATDEVYGHDPDGPSPAEAIEALRDRRIRHVGIEVTGDLIGSTGLIEPGRSQLWNDHALISRGTGTLAVAPVDCDEDGDDDLARGDPLVCTIYTEPDITEALVELILAIRDDRAAALDVKVPAGFSAIVYASGRGSNGVAYPAVDLTEIIDLPFVVTYACEPAVAGTTGVVELTGVVGGLPVATATATLACGPQPERPPPPRPAAARPPVAVAAAPLPPAPPAPVLVQAPAQASAASSASSASFSSAMSVTAVQAPAAAVATAPQTQVQVQRVSIRSDDGGTTMEFTGRRQERLPYATVTLGAGALFAAASALALRRRAVRTPVRLRSR